MTGGGPRIPGLAEEEWSDDIGRLLRATLSRVARLEGGHGGGGAAGPGPAPAPAPALAPAAAAAAVAARRKPLPILPVIARQERLLEPFLAWASALALDGVLPRRDSELLALRAAHNCSSPFEWEHHCVYARAAGITDDELARIAEGPGAGWVPHEAALLQAADELDRRANVSDATWAELADHYEPAALVELVIIVGHYTMLSMLANTAEVPTDAELDASDPARPG